MNEINLEYLKKLTFHLGFGERLNDVLESAIRRELPRFSLGIANQHRPLEIKDINAPRTDRIEYELNFNKAKDSDTYFLNDYKVTLHKTGENQPRIQTFDLERDHRVTAMQAYKLLSGLAFEKEVFLKPRQENTGNQEKVPMWFKLNLDIKNAYGNHPLQKMRAEYGYDLAASIEKYPIKGIETQQQKEEAYKALRNGNYLEAELKAGRKILPVFIAANPQMKTVDIFDRQLREIRDEEIWPERARNNQNTVPASVEQNTEAKEERIPWERQDDIQSGRSIGR